MEELYQVFPTKAIKTNSERSAFSGSLRMVRMTGLEPAVSWSQTRRDTKLRYIRIFNFFVLQKPVCFQLFGQSVCSVPTALTPSCGSQNSRLPFGRGILTATPFCPRCICHRQRSGTMPKPRALPSELHPDFTVPYYMRFVSKMQPSSSGNVTEIYNPSVTATPCHLSSARLRFAPVPLHKGGFRREEQAPPLRHKKEEHAKNRRPSQVCGF